ncbi:hypothetical protein IAQ61_007941, partial [Plenodomus lingam]|uniref:Predicted protein n=1 Tax=Leptosphaeria maculans (strain JN3 / isolate v23.1.3 / race Av1-4-5-6-7-8) TaxID=985895 RepID=E4ZZK2_LEPMJ
MAEKDFNHLTKSKIVCLVWCVTLDVFNLPKSLSKRDLGPQFNAEESLGVSKAELPRKIRQDKNRPELSNYYNKIYQYGTRGSALSRLYTDKADSESAIATRSSVTPSMWSPLVARLAEAYNTSICLVGMIIGATASVTAHIVA